MSDCEHNAATRPKRKMKETQDMKNDIEVAALSEYQSSKLYT